MQYVALGWGLLLTLQARKALFPSEEQVEREMHKERARRFKVEQREEKRKRRQLRDKTHAEFEQAVQDGVLSFVDALRSPATVHAGSRSARAHNANSHKTRVRVATDSTGNDAAKETSQSDEVEHTARKEQR